jgi:hypothetical protein
MHEMKGRDRRRQTNKEERDKNNNKQKYVKQKETRTNIKEQPKIKEESISNCCNGYC